MAPREQGHLHGHGDVPGGDGGKVQQLRHVAHQNTLKSYGQSNGDINKVAIFFVTNIMSVLVGTVPHLSNYSGHIQAEILGPIVL